MSGTSPSPSKRPTMAQRSSSTHSLSSSGRPVNPNKTSGPKVHVVNKHQRNMSHKALNRLPKVASNANVTAEGRAHQRKKSGPVTPTESPKTPVVSNIKRNSSHAALSKNNSHVNLRKNHSAGALASKRNRSSGQLMKLGAQAQQKPKDNEPKQGFFALGDQSSEEEDEGEWEDSTTQSPELSRNQSKASTPLRPRTPTSEPQNPPDAGPTPVVRKLEPPDISTNRINKSAPNLKQAPTSDPPPDPALLQGKARAARAPPAMSTISAQVGLANVKRSDSARSLSKVLPNNSGISSLEGSTPKVGTASSGSGGVSHFLHSSSVATSGKMTEQGSDEDSASFMANYKPQQQDSPERPRSMLNKIQSRAAPSRTNQKMELQRRETMRAGGAAAANPGPGALGLSAGSTVSLHSRSGSKAGSRNRSMVGEMKALKQDYEAATKQLTVVRRFRNPLLESLHRLQEADIIASDVIARTQPHTQTKSRPQSRRGTAPSAAETPKVPLARSPEDKKAGPGGSRLQSQAKHGRVAFQLSRQGSHDDIGLTTSQGDTGEFEEEHDGVSPEEALIRRIWESRVVYENDGVQTAA